MVALVGISWFFASTETALTSCNRIRLKNKAEDGDIKAIKALELANNFDKSLSVLLIGSTIVNLTASSLITVLCINAFGKSGPFIGTVIITIGILALGEILPKSYAKDRPDKIMLGTSGILSFVIKVIYPLSKPFLLLRHLMNKLLGNKDLTEDSMTEAELKYIIDEIEHFGGLEKDESELVQMALDFDEIAVEEIIIPRVDIIAIELKESAQNIQKILLTENFSRVPVYDKTIDNVVGILLQREFFKSIVLNKDFKIEEHLQKPLFVPQWLKISEVLKELKRNKTHMAIVTDEHGGTMGLVTMEDLLEELVGEIWDEYDEVEHNIVKIDDRTYEVEGSMNVKSMMEYLNFSTKNFESEGNTVGGWAMEQLNKILKKGDFFEYKNMTVTIKEIIEQRVTKVIVTLNSEKPLDD